MLDLADDDPIGMAIRHGVGLTVTIEILSNRLELNVSAAVSEPATEHQASHGLVCATLTGVALLVVGWKPLKSWIDMVMVDQLLTFATRAL